MDIRNEINYEKYELPPLIIKEKRVRKRRTECPACGTSGIRWYLTSGKTLQQYIFY